jgi:3-methyladenine DNA glycosylase Mpg
MAMARFLIGKILVRDRPRRGGPAGGSSRPRPIRPPGDAGSHAYRGEAPARRSMFLEPGHGYVCLAYGACFCFNVSSEPAGIGAGILIRALGIDVMRKRRGAAGTRGLAHGPGRPAAAMAIDRTLDGIDLCRKGRAIACRQLSIFSRPHMGGGLGRGSERRPSHTETRLPPPASPCRGEGILSARSAHAIALAGRGRCGS